MAITLKTHKMLWGRAANRCAICRMELVIDATETDDESVVGEACHIVAEREDGPRGDFSLPAGQRDTFANLILLCNVHHKQIDDQVGVFTVERLRDLKTEHESWVKAALQFDVQKQRDDELYSGYVDEWSCRVHLEQWKAWSSWLVSNGQPSLHTEMRTALDEIRPWLLSRVWPGRYKQLEAALTNFRHVAQDLTNAFSEHAAKRSDEYWETEKFYAIREWNPDLYSTLMARFDHHVGLVEDLTLELTRAANFVCDMVRLELFPSYRLREGVLLIQSGPTLNLSYVTYRVEYRAHERGEHPYPGLADFAELRFTRDVFLGEKPPDS